MHRVAVDRDHVEAARWQPAQTREVVLRRESETLLLARGNAGQRPAERAVSARAHLDEDHGAVALAHDQIDLAAV